ncbi:MAG: Mov34/MPN/PAD-1 family protein [Candidatus Scalinduaceae bacterium]
MIYIKHNIINRLLKEAKSAYPFECCGILIGDDSAKKVVREVYPVENKNKERAQDRYEIDSKTFKDIDREATKKRLEIIGLYHSHPDHPPSPSLFDTECASVWPGYSYIIISVKNKKETEVKSWYFDQEKQKLEEEELKIKKHKLLLGLSLIIFSFVIYFCVPFIFFLPLSMEVKTSSAFISYFFSWSLAGSGIYISAREEYRSVKHVLEDFLNKRKKRKEK